MFGKCKSKIRHRLDLDFVFHSLPSSFHQCLNQLKLPYPQERSVDPLDFLVPVQHQLRHRLPGPPALLQQPDSSPRRKSVCGTEPWGEVWLTRVKINVHTRTYIKLEANAHFVCLQLAISKVRLCLRLLSLLASVHLCDSQLRREWDGSGIDLFPDNYLAVTYRVCFFFFFKPRRLWRRIINFVKMFVWFLGDVQGLKKKNHFYKWRECGKARSLLKAQSDEIEFLVLDFDFASQFSQSATQANLDGT